MKKVIATTISAAFFAAFTVNAQILLTDFGYDGFEVQGWMPMTPEPDQQSNSLTWYVPSPGLGAGLSGETWNLVDIAAAWQGGIPIQSIYVSVTFHASFGGIGDYLAISFGDNTNNAATWRYENNDLDSYEVGNTYNIVLSFVSSTPENVDLSKINFFSIELGGTSPSFNATFNGLYAGTPVPEPSTWLLLGAGLATVAIFRRNFLRTK